MKAIVLAAGKGERLRPLTESIPKCLIPISGKPILQYWLDSLEKSGFSDVLINGHYLADQVESFIESIRPDYSMEIHYVYEDELKGTGGTVKKNRSFVRDEDFFLFCHGDNFTNINLKGFVDFHHSKETDLSVALFETTVPEQCGIAEEINDDGRIIQFVEKPDHPKGNLASAAIFLMNPDVINCFPDKDEIDFSHEVLPMFERNMFGYHIDGFNIDIGTMENYLLANKIAEEGMTNMESAN